MSVALYFHSLGSAGGGAERMVCMLANSLSERGCDVHLISWDNDSASLFYPLDGRVAWHRLGFFTGVTGKIRRALRMYKVLCENDIRVLVGFVMSGDKTVYTAAKLARTLLVVAERNSPSMYHIRYGAIDRFISFVMLRLADRITVQSSSFVDGYPDVLRKRIAVIPNPVSPSAVLAHPEVPDPRGKYTLLAVSRLDSVQKRLECLLHAYSRIASRHPDWYLRIIGDGPAEGALRSLIYELGLADRISLEPSTPHIFSAYTQAHLFVIPSLWEGFPNALAEALVRGLPAIGFENASGVADLIEVSQGGWLASGLDDASSLAETLSHAMSDGKGRACKGALAAESMKMFAPHIQLDKWFELIRSLAEE